MGHPLGYTHIYIYIYLSIYLFLFLWGRRIWIRNCAWSFWNAITYSKLRLQLSPIGRHCKWCRWHRLDICNHIGATWSQAILRRNSPSCFVFDKRPQTKKAINPDMVAGVIEPRDNTAGPPKTKTVAAALAESHSPGRPSDRCMAKSWKLANETWTKLPWELLSNRSRPCAWEISLSLTYMI